LGELRDRPHLADLRPDLQQRLASWEVTRVDGGAERLQLVEPAHGDDVALVVANRLPRRRQGNLPHEVYAAGEAALARAGMSAAHAAAGTDIPANPFSRRAP